ncbi:MAG TPA: ornithine carbamoyltransferase [Candidatus Bathyarchaeia archaeon]|nr:ornithine carbamoyltransferase [Candidatus Bathyarchaeia archaeon]
MIDLKGRDVLNTHEWTKAELDQILKLAYKFKAMGKKSRSLQLLKGKTLLLLFFRGSTRTRISFTAAMEQLGGFAQCPDPGDLRLSLENKPGAGESLKDTARVVERYVDAVGIRLSGPAPDKNGVLRPGFGDVITQQFAEYSKIPVINLACDMQHPTQAMADVMVMEESLGKLKGKKFVAMWAYSPIVRHYTSTQADALIAATYGMDVTVAYPEGYDLDPETETLIRKKCSDNNCKFEILHDYEKAVEGANVVFPRTWVSPNYYTHSKDEELQLAAAHKDWKLTGELMKLTNDARFIHVMPFDRGNEVDDSVADGPRSLVYDQAENLLHVRKAFLASILSDVNKLKKI